MMTNSNPPYHKFSDVFFAGLVLAFVSFSLFGTARVLADPPRTIEGIVAVVGPDIILRSEVEEALSLLLKANPRLDESSFKGEKRKEAFDTILENLVVEKIINQEMERLHIEVNEEEIEEILNRMKKQNRMNDTQFERALMAQGVTVEKYEEQLEKQVKKMKLVQLKIKSRLHVPEKDIQTLYMEKMREKEGSYKLKARHILFLLRETSSSEEIKGAHQKAEDAYARIISGEKFEKVAREVSEGPSAHNGGALGVFGRGEMVPEFEKAAFKAIEGRVTRPVRSALGWHLILIEGQIREEMPPLEKVREDLHREVYDREVEKLFREYIEDVRRNTHIQIRSL